MSNQLVNRALRKVLFMVPVLAAGFAPAALPPFASPALAQSYEAGAYPAEELDQLTAPIALYPDPLLGQVLMASTYPEEVVQAERWRSGQMQLSGDVLTAALDELPWDPSVKALTAFPQVLTMMTNNIEWTENLGDAFLASQGAVMDSVQRLRHQAYAAGRFASDPEMSVADNDGYIDVEPVDPNSVYVPWYNPASVFAPWPYADYMPYYFAPPYGYIHVQAGLFGFGVGIAVPQILWGWDTWDWRRHSVHLDDRRWRALDNDKPPPAAGEWHHDPDHRRGVPYQSAGVRARFAPSQPEAAREFRGYSGEPPVVPIAHNGYAPADGVPRRSGYMTPGVKSAVKNDPTFARPAAATWGAGGPAWTPPAEQPQQERPASATPETRPAETPAVETGGGYDARRGDHRGEAPVFESFSRGADARQEGARGAPRAEPQHNEAPRPEPSRPEPPRPEPARSEPAHSEPAGGGGGHDRH